MRAVVMRNKQLVLDTVPDPIPATGEILVKTLACGICGSDLHALKHAEKMVQAAVDTGMPFPMDPSRDVIMGHEFCAEVLELGPDTSAAVKPGDRIVSIPVSFRNGFQGVGYSNEVPGGYGERMVLPGMTALPVPNGLPTEHAALTEPMAVGLHAVNKARMDSSDAAIVVGCGPVGLAVIAALKLKGFGPIVASDFSPLRRNLAEQVGADVVVDPNVERPITAFERAAGGRNAVLFECVGVPGILDELMRLAPRGARIVVVGVCMEDDRIRPIIGVNKELAMQFVFAYAPDEFAETLFALAEGKIPAASMITGRVGLDGVSGAFEALAQPNAHAKILVQP